MKTRTLHALAITAIALGACGKKDEPQPPATADATSTAGGEQGQPRRELEGATPSPTEATKTELAAPSLPGPFATRALAGVPKGAPFIFVGTPKKILDGLGYAGLADKYGALLSGIGREMVEVSGKDFFQLASWSEIGIDLEGSMGIFMPDLGTEALVTFVRLSDAAKFQTFISDTAKKVDAPLTSEKVGDSTLLTVGDNDRNAWLVHGETLYAVAVMRGNGAAALAKEIQARKPEGSILALPELKPALDGLAAPSGLEAGLFVQLRSILEKTALAELESPDKLATGQFDAQLEAAKKAGDQAEIARLEAAITDEKEFFERVQKRRQAERELVKGIIDEVSTLAVGFDIAPDAVEASVRLALSTDGKLRTLVRNAGDAQPILKATRDQPLLLLSGQIDPPAYLAFIEKLMAADGEDLAEVRANIKEHVGIDLNQDVIDQLTGEIGFALTGDLGRLMKAEDPRSELGGALLIGLKSEPGLKAVAARLAAQEGIRDLVTWDEATSSLTATFPEGRKLQLTFSGNRLVASTDLDTATRLGGTESFVAGVGNARLKALLERKDLAALFAMPQSFIGAWFLASRSANWQPELPADATAEAKAKLEELKKLDAEIAPLRATVEEARLKPILEAFDKLGTLAEAVSVDAQGLSATIGIYPKGATVPETLAALIDAAMQMERRSEETPDEVKLRELEDRRWKLESEIFSFNRPKPDELPPEEPEAPKQP